MATPPPLCLAPAGWFCSPLAAYIHCPTNYYCSGGMMPPRQCPDGKRAPEGSIYLADCADSDNVFFGVVLVVLLAIFLLWVCIYCVYDWYDFHGTYRVVPFPSATVVAPPPTPRCRPAPTAPLVFYDSVSRPPCNPNRVYHVVQPYCV